MQKRYENINNKITMDVMLHNGIKDLTIINNRTSIVRLHIIYYNGKVNNIHQLDKICDFLEDIYKNYKKTNNRIHILRKLLKN